MILMVNDVPKGRSGKLWQNWGVGFACIVCCKRQKWIGVVTEGRHQWLEWRKNGASLFEKGKWDAVYQFHPVEKIANKIVIEKYVQLTEKGYCTLVSHLPTPLLESKHVGQDMHAWEQLSQEKTREE